MFQKLANGWIPSSFLAKPHNHRDFWDVPSQNLFKKHQKHRRYSRKRRTAQDEAATATTTIFDPKIQGSIFDFIILIPTCWFIPLTKQVSQTPVLINGKFRILKWRYCTIEGHILLGIFLTQAKNTWYEWIPPIQVPEMAIDILNPLVLPSGYDIHSSPWYRWPIEILEIDGLPFLIAW